MKAQLEDPQDEAATGVQGATSGQKGQNRPKKGPFSCFCTTFVVQTPNSRFSTHHHLTKDPKRKAQLEDTQDEAARGVQGATKSLGNISISHQWRIGEMITRVPLGFGI